MLITFLGVEPYMAVGIALVRCARQRRFGLHLSQKQESRHQKRPYHDGERAALHRHRKLRGKPDPLGNDGQLFRLHDLPARRQIHSSPRDDHEGGDGADGREKARDAVARLRRMIGMICGFIGGRAAA